MFFQYQETPKTVDTLIDPIFLKYNKAVGGGTNTSYV